MPTAPADQPLYEAKGRKGTIQLYEDHVVVDDDSGMILSTGSTKRIPIEEIIDIDIREPSTLKTGWVSIIQKGHSSNISSAGDAVDDKNTILYARSRRTSQMMQLTRLITSTKKEYLKEQKKKAEATDNHRDIMIEALARALADQSKGSTQEEDPEDDKDVIDLDEIDKKPDDNETDEDPDDNEDDSSDRIITPKEYLKVAVNKDFVDEEEVVRNSDELTWTDLERIRDES